MRTLYSFLVVIFFSMTSFAQTTAEEKSRFDQLPVSEVATSNKPPSPPSADFNHIFSIDFLPLIDLLVDSPGIGLGYQFILNSHYSIGANVYYKKQKFTENYPDEVTLRFINTGIEARYKFSSFAEDGFYSGLGLTSSGVKGDVTMGKLLSNKTANAETNYQWETLVVPRMGYMWVPSSKGTYGDLSLSYEALNGADIAYQSWADGSQSASMEIKKRKIGMNFTFVMGLVF